MKNNQFELPNIDFYKECDEKGLNELKKISEKRIVRKGAMICKPGDHGMVYLVSKGRIQLYVLSDSGKKFILSVLKKGNIFGDFNMDIPSMVFCEAMEPTELVILKTERFSPIVMKEPRLLFKLFKYFYIRLLSVQLKAISLGTDDVIGRLTKLLVQLAKPVESSSAGILVTDRYTHEQLSQMLGVSRQTITMTLNDLERRGYLKRKKKSFLFAKKKLEKAN